MRKMIEQRAYPPHASDNGPLLPASGGRLICGRCHVIIPEPSFDVLSQARACMVASGEKPINVDRPIASRLTHADLSQAERDLLVRVMRGKGNGASAKMEIVVSLMRLGLVRESVDVRGKLRVTARSTTANGERVAAQVLAAVRPAPVNLLAFDLGPPGPRR